MSRTQRRATVSQDNDSNVDVAATRAAPIAAGVRSANDRRPGIVIALLLVLISPGYAQKRVIPEVQKRVVKIFGAGGLRNLNAYSSGIIVDRRGYVATVWNHVLDTNELAVVLSDGRRFQAEVVAAEPTLDLAVLRLRDTGELKFPSFRLAAVRTVDPGTRVLAFSNVFRVATGDEPVTVQHGVVAARTKLSTRRGVFDVPFETELYVVDAITNNAGAEGGILTTLAGQPFAMIGRQLRNGSTNTWVNYGVPLTYLRDPIEQMIAGKYVAMTPQAGADQSMPTFMPEDVGLVMVPDVVERTPGYIDQVVPASPAAKAGLQSGDLVVFVNDGLVRSCAELRAALATLAPKQQIEIVVRRGDALKTFRLTAPNKSRGSDGR